MNIEILTQELQTRSKARNALKKQFQPSSVTSSIVDLQDSRSDVDSTSFDQVNPSSAISQSWVESSGSHSPAPSVTSSTSEIQLSESMISSSAGLNVENSSSLVLFSLSLN